VVMSSKVKTGPGSIGEPYIPSGHVVMQRDDEVSDERPRYPANWPGANTKDFIILQQ
jgi:hypothetical protein